MQSQIHDESPAKPRTMPMTRIAAERVSSISVNRVGLAVYDLYTTRDIKRFQHEYSDARFTWDETQKMWFLFQPVRDLQSCTIRIAKAEPAARGRA